MFKWFKKLLLTLYRNMLYLALRGFMNSDVKKKKLLIDLSDICQELNWVIGIPKEAMTAGIICGNLEYVEAACLAIYGTDGYEIISEETAQAKLNKDKEEVVTSENKINYDMVELTESEFKKFLETGDLPENFKFIGENDDEITYH